MELVSYRKIGKMLQLFVNEYLIYRNDSELSFNLDYRHSKQRTVNSVTREFEQRNKKRGLVQL